VWDGPCRDSLSCGPDRVKNDGRGLSDCVHGSEVVDLDGRAESRSATADNDQIKRLYGRTSSAAGRARTRGTRAT
jgi:hypothetical protein